MVKLDYPFNIYRELTNNDYFHFGLWEEDTGSIEQAQDALAELLIGVIQERSGNVLEIGSGLGKFAARVAEKGHSVTGIEIDKGKVEYAAEKYSGPKTIFLDGDFLEMAEKLDRACFDTVILFESSQYFADLKALFAACRALLREKGRIVLCDEIIHSLELKSRTSVKLFDEYLSGLYENGFKIADHQDIGRKVMPTCQYMVQNLPRLHRHEGTQALLDGWKFQKDMYEKGLFGYVILEAAKDPYFLQKYAENMEQEIVPAFNDTFAVHRSMSHWKWKYKENPFGKEAVVIVRDQDRSLVGHYSGYYMPWFSRRDDQTYNIIQGVDTFTVNRVRRIGLGKTGLFARMGRYFFANFCNHRMPFAYGVNTASAHELGKRYLGYRPIESVGYYCLNGTEITKRSVIKRIFFNQYRVETIDSFGQEFDQLFHSALQDYPPLIVKRDSLYLNWRYSDPDKSYTKAALFRGGDLVGYGVAEIQDKILTIGDVFLKKKHSDALPCLIDFFQDRHQPDSLELWISAKPLWLKERLETLGFKKQPPPFGLTLIYLKLSSRYADDVMQDLYYTKSDTDLF